MHDAQRVVESVLALRRRSPAGRALLVAMSGIDGAGKGYLAARLVSALLDRGLKVAGLSVDPWLRLPAERFSAERPAEHFYRRALRFEEMFRQLVLPLQRERSLRVEADVVEETSTAYCRRTFEFKDVDVIVLEGIYLFQRAFHGHYDLAIWVECSFETALERALARRQEGLPLAETVRAYETIYFPAQLLHFELDAPWTLADLIVTNDPVLTVPDAPGNPWSLPVISLASDSM